MSSLSDGIGKVSLLVVATAVCFGTVELGLRIHYAVNRTAALRDLAALRIVPPRGTSVQLGDLIQRSPHERLVFELRPKLDVEFLGARVRINASGCRDKEVPQDKPPNTIRIVGIGDSVMFGWSVEESERYTNVLESLLNNRYPDARWQVLTLAAPGYNLVMELEALERYGLAYDPDLVIYGYVANDTCLPNFVADEADVFGRRSFLLGYLANVPIPSPRLISRDAAVGNQVNPADFVRKYCTPSSVPARYRNLVGEENFQSALERLKSLGVEHGFPIVLVTHPLLSEFDWPNVPPGITTVYGTAKPGEPGSIAPLPGFAYQPRGPPSQCRRAQGHCSQLTRGTRRKRDFDRTDGPLIREVYAIKALAFFSQGSVFTR